MRNNKKGFTLVELLVVIAIIGLLSTLAVVALNNARQKARDARRMSDIKQIQTALELYYNDKGGYPTQAEADMDSGDFECLSADSAGGFAAACSGTTYMQKVPANPTPDDGGGDYHYTPADATTVSDNDEYSIEYYLAGDTGGITAGWNTACSSGVSGCTAQ